MRKIWKVTITGNYLIINKDLRKYFWVSKDQSSCYQLTKEEKAKFFREYTLQETKLELKDDVLKKIIRIEKTQEPDIMLGKLEDMKQEISLAS